eukprot:3896213-Prymnesium_polylepis.1
MSTKNAWTGPWCPLIDMYVEYECVCLCVEYTQSRRGGGVDYVARLHVSHLRAACTVCRGGPSSGVQSRLAPGALLVLACAVCVRLPAMLFRFLFFTTHDVPIPSDGVALSEVQLLAADGSTLPILSASNPGGITLPRETAGFVADGSVSTKWLDLGFNHSASGSSILELEAEPTAQAQIWEEVAGYSFYTAGDAPKRDPTGWRLEARMHATADETWQLVHERRGMVPPNQRRAEYGPFWTLAPPPPPPTPVYRLVVTEPRSPENADAVALDELMLYVRGTGTAAPISRIWSPDGVMPHNQGAERAVDGVVGTKWLDSGYPSARRAELRVELRSDTELGSYNLRTANDRPIRDPVSWTFERRTPDGASWLVLHSVWRYVPPVQRLA